MIKLLILLLPLVGGLVSSQCEAQHFIYRKGYIVKNHGDTAWGYIGATNWQFTPIQIKFCKDSSGVNSVRLWPGDVQAIRFPEGEHFSSGYITWNDLATLASQAAFRSVRDSIPVYSKVFLRALVEGPISLYKYEDERGPRFAISETMGEGDTSFITLGNDATTTGAAGHSQHTSIYKRQLIKLATERKPGNLPLQSQIWIADYSEPAFIDIITALNKDSSTYYYKEEIHRRNNVYFSIGEATANFSIQGNNYNLDGLKFRYSPVPYYKVGYEFNSSLDQPSITIRLGVVFWNVNYKAFGPDKEYSLQQFTLQPMVSVLKTIIYAGNRTEIFAGGEGGLNFSFYKGNTVTWKGGNYPAQVPDAIDLQPYWFSFTVVAGIFLDRRRWEISPFYQFSEQYAWDYGYGFISKLFGVSLSYHLLKKN